MKKSLKFLLYVCFMGLMLFVCFGGTVIMMMEGGWICVAGIAITVFTLGLLPHIDAIVEWFKI